VNVHSAAGGLYADNTSGAVFMDEVVRSYSDDSN